MCCIAIILDVFSLSVFAKLTLYFKFSLVSIVCSFLFSGNKSFSLDSSRPMRSLDLGLYELSTNEKFVVVGWVG